MFLSPGSLGVVPGRYRNTARHVPTVPAAGWVGARAPCGAGCRLAARCRAISGSAICVGLAPTSARTPVGIFPPL